LRASLACLTTLLSLEFIFLITRGGTHANKTRINPIATKANKKEITPISKGARWHHMESWVELLEILLSPIT
jgi:hypothetical protein